MTQEQTQENQPTEMKKPLTEDMPNEKSQKINEAYDKGYVDVEKKEVDLTPTLWEKIKSWWSN